jgi:hypothetical protein
MTGLRASKARDSSVSRLTFRTLFKVSSCPAGKRCSKLQVP